MTEHTTRLGFTTDAADQAAWVAEMTAEGNAEPCTEALRAHELGLDEQVAEDWPTWADLWGRVCTVEARAAGMGRLIVCLRRQWMPVVYPALSDGDYAAALADAQRRVECVP